MAAGVQYPVHNVTAFVVRQPRFLRKCKEAVMFAYHHPREGEGDTLAGVSKAAGGEAPLWLPMTVACATGDSGNRVAKVP